VGSGRITDDVNSGRKLTWLPLSETVAIRIKMFRAKLFAYMV